MQPTFERPFADLSIAELLDLRNEYIFERESKPASAHALIDEDLDLVRAELALRRNR